MRTLTVRPRRLGWWSALAVVAIGLAACAGESAAPTSTAVPSPAATDEPTATAEPTSTVSAPDIVLAWTREGGIAGFCDGLLLTTGHRASLGSCEDSSGDARHGVIAPNVAILEFESFRAEFASFEVEWADDDTIADGMTIRLTFVGRGDTVASDEQRLAIAEFASRLFAEIAAAQPRA